MQLKRINNSEYPLLFTFKYSQLYVDKCREIKDKFGYQNFCFDGKLKGWLMKWRCFEELSKVFPYVSIPEEIIIEYNNLLNRNQKIESQIIKSKQFELETDLPLFPYQKVGVNFMVQNKKCMNNDDMGLGKSLQSITVIHHFDFNNVLIICPNSLKSNWQREIIKWIDRDSWIIEDRIYKSGIQIMNYEKLIKFADCSGEKIKLSKELFENFELIIFDECHYIKERKAKRTKLALQLAKLCDRVILLTGTPMLNKPKELITQINAIGKMEEFGSDWKFLNRYCDPKSNGFGLDFNGASNIPELKEKIERFSIRRLKKDVLDDLPDKMINTTYLDLPEPRAYKEIEVESTNQIIDSDEQYKLFYKSLAGKSKEQRAEKIVRSQMEGEFKELTANVLVQIEKLKQEAARQKVIASQDIFEEYISNQKKVVVFCTHKKTVHDLELMYPQSFIITGEIKPEDRMKRITEFEKNPRILFLFATMQTTGTGFNLTSSSEVLFMELGWTPAEHKQCEDRCWRIGQKHKVNVNYLVAKNTIDEDIIEVLNNKSEVIEGAIRGELLNKFILKIFNKEK